MITQPTLTIVRIEILVGIMTDLFANGMNGTRPGTVFIVPNRLYDPPRVRQTALFQALYAFTALHETLHLGKEGWYDDEQLVTAAYSVAGKTLPKSDLTGFQRVQHFSNLLDDELKLHCPYPQP